MDDVENPLGSFLRARRARVDPADHELRTVGPRRTPGLRREEVASLAGISVEYLVRLERGRDRRPSPAVVQGLARVLRLDDDGLAHLRSLVAAGDADAAASDDGRPSDELLALMADWPHPAIVMNRFMDLLAINEAGRAMHAGIGLGVGDNMTRTLFLDPRSADVYPELDLVAEENVANLRSLAGSRPDDPRLRELVGELSVASEHFARLWAANDVQRKTSGAKIIDVSPVGRLSLTWQTFEVAEARGQLLVTYRPVAGTRTSERLELLRRDAPDAGALPG